MTHQIRLTNLYVGKSAIFRAMRRDGMRSVCTECKKVRRVMRTDTQTCRRCVKLMVMKDF